MHILSHEMFKTFQIKDKRTLCVFYKKTGLTSVLKDKIRTLIKTSDNCFLTKSLIECLYGFRILPKRI